MTAAGNTWCYHSNGGAKSPRVSTAALARAMITRRLIVPAGDDNLAKTVKVPGHGAMRLYVMAPSIIGDGAEGDNAG
jgi:hypothetical protein